jgi:cytochrome P450
MSLINFPEQLDIVDDFAHPLPVRVISELLGVPIEDKVRFEVWVSALIRTIEPAHNVSEAEVEESASRTVIQMTEDLRDLVITHRDRPRDDLISALVVGKDVEEWVRSKNSMTDAEFQGMMKDLSN